jgi:6-pyruvoyltetrahydropterin/6-carboxytetrahydropterin synthase
MSTHTVAVRHSFETAHRLPHLGGKCANLHGHSWWTEVALAADRLSADGIVVEFGAYKKALREWLDTRLDHGVMLGFDDPLRDGLAKESCKVFAFGSGDGQSSEPAVDASDLDWPTVENVATLISRVATVLLGLTPHAPTARVCRVKVRETQVNSAEWCQ